MKCLVCTASWPDADGQACPKCHYDAAAPDARDPARIQAARRSFRDATTAYAPETRVTRVDRLLPWLGLALGFAIFVLWLRACSTGGFF